jgi:DNA-binding transcriptional LysR family regulator
MVLIGKNDGVAALSRPTLDRMEVFLAVVDQGGFSAAARKLGRPQSSVSHAVAELERDLGVLLFDRSGWKPQLTEGGRSLLEETRALSRQMDRLLARARLLKSGVETELSIVVDVMVPLPALAETAREFQVAFASTALRLHVEALGAVVSRVLEGASALGITGSYYKPPELLEGRLIGRVPLVPVAAPDHPLAQHSGPVASDELARHVQLVVTDRSEMTASEDFGVLSPRTWRLSDLGVKRVFLLEGLGWGNMPLPLVTEDLDAGRLIRMAVEEPLPRGGLLPIRAVHRRDSPPGPAGRWLAERLEEALKAGT